MYIARTFQVYCGKLPKDVYEDELVPLFEKCGTIWDLRIMMDPATGQGRGFCFVTFTEKSAAELAVKEVSTSRSSVEIDFHSSFNRDACAILWTCMC